MLTLLARAHCRLAQEADVIACLLPDGDPESLDIAAAHLAERADRPVVRSRGKGEIVARTLVATGHKEKHSTLLLRYSIVLWHIWRPDRE